MRNFHHGLVLACSIFFASSQVVSAQGQASDSGKRPTVQFTRVQDLDPNSTSSTNRPVRRKWAVVIGIGKYQDRRLNNDVPNDKAAREFHSYLIDEKYGRFSPSQVKLLTNESATQRNITSALGSRWLGGLAEKDDLVVVFIATNGFPTTDGGTYLSAYDCALDNIYGTCLSIKDLMQGLRANVRSDRVVLVLQSSYSGSADLTSGAKSFVKRSYNLDLSQLMLGKGYVILSSSKPDQMTFDDTFSHNLIAALKEQDGLISLQSAFNRAKQQTEYDTTYRSSPPKTQTPTMKSEWVGADLVLGTPPLEKVANLPEDISTFVGAEGHYLKASQAAVAGNIDAAIPEYKLAIASDPNYADAIGDLGVAYGLTGQWQDAIKQLSKAIELQPRDVLFRTNLARAFDAVGDKGQCIKQLEYAYSINPKDTVVLKALANKAITARDFGTAEKLLTQATELYPGSAPMHDRLAYAQMMLGDTSGALANADKAIQLDANLLSARLNRGSILLARGDVQGAIAAYREVLQRDTNNSDAMYLLSQAAEKGRDEKLALTMLDRFLAVCSPSDPRGSEARDRVARLRQANTQ